MKVSILWIVLLAALCIPIAQVINNISVRFESKAVLPISVAHARTLPTIGTHDHKRDPLSESDVDPFKKVNFTTTPIVEPQPLPPLAEPPVQSAPAFPFRYFGRMAGPDGKMTTYLSRDDTLVPIEQGMELDGGYTIESVSETEIVVNYVPLTVRVVVNIRAAE